jgi:isopentenyldiphosphate isomerase
MSEANMTKEPEQWDIYDESRQKTGRTMNRGEHIPGAYHLVVHVCLFSAAGKMLIQQRQPFKEGFPNLWDLTVGGSALAGETSRQAAVRETAEEIGYSWIWPASILPSRRTSRKVLTISGLSAARRIRPG